MEWPEITKDTPVEEVMRIHRMIWDYVIEYGRKPITPYISGCALCEYTRKVNGYLVDCDNCPVDWPNKIPCTRGRSLFSAWRLSSPEKCHIYAKQIRDIKIKEEYQHGRSEDPIRSGELSE